MSGFVTQYGPLDGWPPDAPVRDVRLRASSLEARLELCRQGDAALVLPRFVASLHNDQSRRDEQIEERAAAGLLGNVNRRVYVVRRAGSSPDVRQRIASISAGVAAVCARS